jgi:DNA-binding transcriptional LysR family regulator
MPFDLKQLRCAIAAYDLGSFRKAATAFGVQQSTVSRRVRNLEDRMGASIFIRQPSGVLPTLAGDRFIGHARKVVLQADLASTEVGAAGQVQTGAIRIGLLPSLTPAFVRDLLQTFSSKHPGVRIALIEGSPSDHVKAIRGYRIDLAFISELPEGHECDVTTLWSERVLVACPEASTPYGQTKVSWDSLQNCRFLVGADAIGESILLFLRQRFAEKGRRPTVEFHSVGWPTAMQLVAMRRGVALASESMAETSFHGVTFLPLENETVDFSAIWSPRNDNPAFRRLLSLARQLRRQPKEK